MGVSSDAPGALKAFGKENNLHHVLLSDFPRRQMLTAYGVLQTDQASPIFNYAKRAYFIIGRDGTVKFMKVQDNALNLLDPNEVLEALKASGA